MLTTTDQGQTQEQGLVDHVSSLLCSEALQWFLALGEGAIAL